MTASDGDAVLEPWQRDAGTSGVFCYKDGNHLLEPVIVFAAPDCDFCWNRCLVLLELMIYFVGTSKGGDGMTGVLFFVGIDGRFCCVRRRFLLELSFLFAGTSKWCDGMLGVARMATFNRRRSMRMRDARPGGVDAATIDGRGCFDARRGCEMQGTSGELMWQSCIQRHNLLHQASIFAGTGNGVGRPHDATRVATAAAAADVAMTGPATLQRQRDARHDGVTKLHRTQQGC